MFRNKALLQAFKLTSPVILMVAVSIVFALSSVNHPSATTSFVPIPPTTTQSQPGIPTATAQPKPTGTPILDDNGFLIGYEPINTGLEPDQ
jgi:hypothetical protein